MAFVWPEKSCEKCGLVKKEKPDQFKSRLDQKTMKIVYRDVCIACERREKGYDHQLQRNRAHAAAVKERKEKGKSYEELLEEMEKAHGPSERWPMMLHIELSGKLYRQGNVKRYMEQPEVLPADEQAKLPVDYGSPLFRPSAEAVRALREAMQ